MKLEQLADIISGRTFKHGIPESSNWTHKVVQLRDIEENPFYAPLPWEHLVGTEININRSNSELIKNDILIVAKGLRKRAVHLFDIPYPTIPHQHFFIVRIKDLSKFSPPFIRDYINSSAGQTWLNENSVGSYQSTISKKVLSQLPVPSLSYEKQKAIAEVIANKRYQIIELENHISALKNEIDSQLNELAQGLKE